MFHTIEQIKQANKNIGHHWFSPSTLRFFKCRISPYIYAGKYFVTSEKGPDNIRAYTIRMALPNGEIDTVGQFQEYKTSKQAHRAASKLI